MSDASPLLRHIMMDKALSDKLGQEFEDFFSKLGIILWGDDFELWKPQGRFGDFKCDGYLISKKTVFQCYAPKHLEQSKADTKIIASFDGAKSAFGKRMSKWCFVHNSREGLHPTSNMLLAELRDQNPDIEIKSWGPDGIINEARANPAVLENLFPEVLKDSQLDRATEDALMAFAELIRDRRNSEFEQDVVSNQIRLAGLLDQLAGADKDIRLRVLALCMWFDPIPLEQVKSELMEREYSESVILTNVDRLCEEGMIIATSNHLLPLNTQVCQEAADELFDEFSERLNRS
jgi:hypothetical protein